MTTESKPKKSFKLTTETAIRSYYWTVRGKEGRGYVEDQGKRNERVKRWIWLGFVVWTQVLDTEEVPSHVWISCSTLGSYEGEWRSKFFGV